MIRSEDVNFVYTDENIPQNIETLLEEKDVRLCKIPANMSEN
jgi:hypothetical protein